jgi:hypothetical protein
VLFYHFDRFLAEYEGRFEKEYGFLRPITKEVVERYLECGNPRLGKYMIRPLLSLERLSLDEQEGKVGYRYGKEANEMERIGYLEFIARTTSHIPDKGQATVRYYGLYANGHRGKVKKASRRSFSSLRLLRSLGQPGANFRLSLTAFLWRFIFPDDAWRRHP